VASFFAKSRRSTTVLGVYFTTSRSTNARRRISRLSRPFGFQHDSDAGRSGRAIPRREGCLAGYAPIQSDLPRANLLAGAHLISASQYAQPCAEPLGNALDQEKKKKKKKKIFRISSAPLSAAATYQRQGFPAQNSVFSRQALQPALGAKRVAWPWLRSRSDSISNRA